jgi:hypothetical protein
MLSAENYCVHRGKAMSSINAGYSVILLERIIEKSEQFQKINCVALFQNESSTYG